MSENDEGLHGRDEDEDDDEPDVEPSNGHVNFGPTTPPVTQAPKTRRPRRGRPGGPPVGTGAWEGHAGGKGTRISAMEIWPDLLEELNKSGKTPYELAVRVVCEDPPPTRPIGNAFDASAIVGDRSTSPSDRLYQMVRDNYHMTWAKGPAIYDVQFVWKDGGKIARRGSLQMPHPDEIIGMKQVGGGGFGGAPGVGRPPQQQQQPQYAQPQYPPPGAGPQPWQGPYGTYGQPQPQYAPPAQQYAPPQSDETVQLRAELQRERENSARMQGQLDEILKAMREGRAPNTPAPAVATPVAAAPAAPPPQQPVDLDGVVFRILDRMGFKPGVGAPPPAATPAPTVMNATDEAVLRVLDRLGIKPGMPGIGVGTPAASPKTVVDETDAAVNAFERMVTSIARVRGFGKKLDKIFSDDIPEVAAEVVEDAKEGKLPFDAVAIPEVKWSDGRPVMYTSSPDGKIDWTAAAFSNPAVVEKVAEGFTKFMGTIGKVVQAAARQPQGVGGVVEETEVVDDTPEGAQDGGSFPNGMG
jgi:hypothetical protein